MFVWSMKLSRKKAYAGLLMICIFFGGLLLWTGNSVKEANVSVDGGQTNEQRLAYLAGFGWEVREEPVEIVEVQIPVSFGAVYESYNEIQKMQGYDLWKYAGKRVKRFAYEVTNYPNNLPDIRANVLVYKGKVIGGDICSTKVDGILHGFELKS